jgi:hypothetical protein
MKERGRALLAGGLSKKIHQVSWRGKGKEEAATLKRRARI